MRQPMNFTPRAIADLDLEPGEHDLWVWDPDRTGLGLRMRRGKTGTSKTFYVMYRFGGQKKRLRLGDVSAYTLADARHRAYEIRRDVEDDKDPQAAKLTAKAKAVAASLTPIFGNYAADYLKDNQPKWSASFYRNTARYLADGPHSAPFRKLRLDRVSKAMIASHVKQLESNGITGLTATGDMATAKPSKYTAQAWRDAVLRLFKAAIEDGNVEANPVDGTRRPAPPKETARERVLTNDELGAVWNASGDDTYGKLTKLAILLGNRRQELGGMRWSEIDDAGVWTIPAKRTKTDRLLKLPLPAAALEIIRSVPKVEGRDLVFGGSTGNEFARWSDGKRYLDARLAFEQPWVFHDLRRTLTNRMPNLGVLPHVVEAIVNHAPPPTVHNIHYANDPTLYLPQKAEALQRWADHVLALAGKNVVPFKREGVA